MNKEVLKKLSYGVYAITTNIDGKDTGCIANSLIQVTYNTIAVSLNHKNFTNLCVAKSNKFGISILGEDIDNNIITTFGYQSGADIDKFEHIKYREIDGIRIINGALGYLICKVVDKFETETHTIFLGEILDGEIFTQEEPMTYAYYHKERKGTTPKNAPTYIENEKVDSETAYKCSICGYIYRGDITKEPEDYVCPICKQPKSVFEKL